MDKKDWSIKRTHKPTGNIYYLSPGRVRWIHPTSHERYGTRYGHWTRQEAEENLAYIIKHSYSDDFILEIVPFQTIN